MVVIARAIFAHTPFLFVSGNGCMLKRLWLFLDISVTFCKYLIVMVIEKNVKDADNLLAKAILQNEIPCKIYIKHLIKIKHMPDSNFITID